MTAPIQLNTYIPKDQDPNREINLARIVTMKKGILPATRSTVFVFRDNKGQDYGNPALGALDPTLTYRKIGNPKAVEIVSPKPLKARVKRLQPEIALEKSVTTQTPPSETAAPLPRALTPPPAPPKELTSPEKVIQAAKALTEITNIERQGFKIRKQMRAAAEKRKVDALPTPPQEPKKARTSSSITQN